MKVLDLVRSDLVRAGSLKSEQPLGIFRLIPFLRFRHCRVSFLIRLGMTEAFVASSISRFLLRAIYKIEIGKSVKIGYGLFLPHPQCIIVSDGVVLGDNVSVAQYATIGGNQKKVRYKQNGEKWLLPIVGSNVWIGPGAVVGGPISISDHVIIGANSVVTKDVPGNSLVYGQNNLSKNSISVDSENGTYIRKED